MRLLSYSFNGQPSFGVLSGDGRGVFDLASRLDGVADLGDLIGQQRLAEVEVLRDSFEAARNAAPLVTSGDNTSGVERNKTAGSAAGVEPDLDLADITFERLIPRPPKILCIGVNYGGRDAEYSGGAERHRFRYPSVFVRFPETLVGHEQPLLRPPESVQLDYEGEIVVVIGRGGRRIPIHESLDHIAGVTIGNEGTVRDWVRHGRFNVTQGKNWQSSGAIGPWLVTLDEIDDLDSLRLTTRVNGEVRQQDTPAGMHHSIKFQVHYLSTFIALKPGDVIFTGTPAGAGARLDPPRWLAPGDVVEVTVKGVGTLRNRIRDEFEGGSGLP